MQSYHDNLILQFDDQATGNAASGQLVTVFDAGLATKPAIFDTLGSPIANPLTTDIKGNFSFTIADGVYDIVGRAGTPDETRRDQVQIAVPSAAIIPRLNPATLAIAIADPTLELNDVLHVKERTTGNGGGAIWDVVLTSTVTPNTFYIAISTGDALLSLVLRESIPSSAMLGSVFTSALLDALLFFDNVTLSPGTYPVYDFDQTDKRITVEKGAIFKLPDNTTNAGTTEPVSVLAVSGTDLTFSGVVEVNGNLANNPSDSMDTSRRIGAAHISGTNIRFEDELNVKNASWVAVSTGSETDKAVDFFADLITVINPFSYSTSFWSVDGLQINRIFVRAGANSTDARVRIGSQITSTFNAIGGFIGSVLTNDTFVIEARTTDFEFPSVICKAAKAEDASRITLGTIQSRNAEGGAFSFALITCQDVTVNTLHVDEHDGDTSKAVVFTEVIGCSIKTIHVTNTKNDANDVEIRSASGLTIDNMILTSPDGIGRGFLFDFDVGFAPQEHIRIGNIISTGHTGLDVEVQSASLVDLIIENINPDATTNLPYLKNGNIYQEGTFPATLTPTTSGSITLSGSNTDLAWTRIGREVTIVGRVKVSAVSSPVGNITLGTLPFTVLSGTDQSGRAEFFITTNTTAGTWSGIFAGVAAQGGTTINIEGLDGNLGFTTADLMQFDTTLGFSFSYFTDD